MSYIITSKTYALIPNGSNTKVIEENNSLEIKSTPTSIVKLNCYLNGSTLEGQSRGSAYLTGNKYKPPIALGKEKIILIPTCSNRNKDCIWLSLSSIKKYYQKDEFVIIEFYNNAKVSLKTSFYVLDKQILKATRLESILRGRNELKSL